LSEKLKKNTVIYSKLSHQTPVENWEAAIGWTSGWHQT